MNIEILGFAAVMLVGFSLSTIGAGGAIVLLPVFTYLFGFGSAQAVSMSLLVVCLSSLLSATLKRHSINWEIFLYFVPFSALGSVCGSWLAHRSWVSEHLQMSIFAIVALLAGIQTLRPAVISAPDSPLHKIISYVFFGLLIGVLTGFLGIGGGFVIVPVLMGYIGLAAPAAVATSVSLIAFNSLIAILYNNQPIREHFDIKFFLYVLGSAALGVLIGATLQPSTKHIRYIFGVLLIVIALGVLWVSH